MSSRHILNGAYLSRVLDNKFRKFRALLTAEEDVSTELDRVVCCLMKLALSTTRCRHSPPPTWWMQLKLFYLLTLAEKAIERRQRHFIDNYPLEDDQSRFNKKSTILDKFKEDLTTNVLLEKYYHVVEDYQDNCGNNQEDQDLNGNNRTDVDMMSNSQITQSSNDLDEDMEFRNEDINYPQYVGPPPSIEQDINHNLNTSISPLESIPIDEIPEEETPHIADEINSKSKTSDIDSIVQSKDEKSLSKSKIIRKKIRSNLKKKIKTNKRIDKKIKANPRLTRNIICRSAPTTSVNCYENTNTMTTDNKKTNLSVVTKVNWESHEVTDNQLSIGKPIPNSIIELSRIIENATNDKHALSAQQESKNIAEDINICVEVDKTEIAVTEESFFINIVTEDIEEVIALRRSIGTDPEEDSMSFQDLYNNSIADLSNVYINNVLSTSVESQTIFLVDINEPTTSKGIRHISMDARCGSDTSLNNLSKIDAEIGNVAIDFGTGTSDNVEHLSFFSDRQISKGIYIKDSDFKIGKEQRIVEVCDQETQDEPVTKFLKTASSQARIHESGSDLCASIGCLQKGSFKLYPCLSNGAVTEKISATLSTGKNKLSCDTIHIHSFRERQASLDVVCQGRWEPRQSKSRINSRLNNLVIKKNIMGKIQSKNSINKDNMPNQKKYIPKVQLKKTQIQRIQDVKNGFKPNNKEVSKILNLQKMKTVPNNSKSFNTVNKPIVNYKLSRTSASSAPSKCEGQFKNDHNRPINKVDKNNQKLTRPQTTNLVQSKYGQKERNPPIKNPLYKSIRTPKEIVRINKDYNKTKTIASNDINTKKKQIFITVCKENKTKEDSHIYGKYESKLKHKLLKPITEQRPKVSYLVYRNTLDTSKNSIKSPVPITNSSKSSPTREYHSSKKKSCISLSVSSSCSSRNSVATVRIASTSSNQSPNIKQNNNYKENSPKAHTFSKNYVPLINKSQSTASKSSKEQSPKKTGPEVSTENILECESIDTSPMKKKEKLPSGGGFVGKNKNVYVANVKLKESGRRGWETRDDLPKKQNILNRIHMESTQEKTEEPLKSKDEKDLCDFKTSSDLEVIANENISVNTIRSIPSNEKILNKSLQNLEDSINNEILMPQVMNLVLQNEADLTPNSSLNIFIRNMIGTRLDFISGGLLANERPTVNSVYSSQCNNSNTTRDIHKLGVNNSSIGKSNLNTANTKLCDVTNQNDCETTEHVLSNVNYNNYYNTNCSRNSVQGIFERKEPPLQTMQNPSGLLAVQAFSGFSVNGETTSGDRPNFSAFMDLEANWDVEIGRQVVSEELHVSGRASPDSDYQSCQIEDDADVPSWLFEMMSEQPLHHDEEPLPDIPPAQGPLPEEFYDDNGNVESTTRPGTGAGDGCGVHSDYSQDSSGQGISITSSNTNSSGANSETITDPLLNSAQYHPLIDSDSEPILRPSVRNNGALSTSTAQVVLQNPIATEDENSTLSSSNTDDADF